MHVGGYSSQCIRQTYCLKNGESDENDLCVNRKGGSMVLLNEDDLCVSLIKVRESCAT